MNHFTAISYSTISKLFVLFLFVTKITQKILGSIAIVRSRRLTVGHVKSMYQKAIGYFAKQCPIALHVFSTFLKVVRWPTAKWITACPTNAHSVWRQILWSIMCWPDGLVHIPRSNLSLILHYWRRMILGTYETFKPLSCNKSMQYCHEHHTYLGILSLLCGRSSSRRSWLPMEGGAILSRSCLMARGSIMGAVASVVPALMRSPV